MFAYVIDYFGVNQMRVCDLYCKRYEPRSNCLGAVRSGFIVLYYVTRFVLEKIEKYAADVISRQHFLFNTVIC